MDYKSSELQKLAIDVGLEESNPAFADKIGTLMDSLGIDDESLPTVEQVIEYMASNKPNEDIVLSDNGSRLKHHKDLLIWNAGCQLHMKSYLMRDLEMKTEM